MKALVTVIGIVVIALSVVAFLVNPIVGVGMFLGSVAGISLANIVA